MLFDEALKTGRLSQGDLAVADYVTRHPQEVLHLSSRALAEAAFVSPATVVRLCKKAGFASYGDMKVALAQELGDEEAYEHLDADFPELEDASSAQVIARVSSLERQAVRKTERLLEQVDWEPILKALDKSKGVTIYALGYSMDASRMFAHDMRRMGWRVTSRKEGSEAREWASSCSRDEFSIFMSYTGMTNMTNDAARILYRRGLRSLAITAEGDNPLAHACTWHIPVALTQRRFVANRVANVQSFASQSYVLHVLYTLYFSRNYARNKQHLDATLERQGIRVGSDADGETSLVPLGDALKTWLDGTGRYV